MTPNYTESKIKIMDADVKHLNMFCREEIATGSQQGREVEGNPH